MTISTSPPPSDGRRHEVRGGRNNLVTAEHAYVRPNAEPPEIDVGTLDPERPANAPTVGHISVKNYIAERFSKSIRQEFLPRAHSRCTGPRARCSWLPARAGRHAGHWP